MNSYADNGKENKKQPASLSIQKKDNRAVGLPFVNTQSSAAAQIQLQEIADNSPQVKQAFQLQAMANAYSALPVQKKRNEEEKIVQEKFESVQKKANNTGLPDNLKSGIENLSHYSMDDVKVHYNSDKPAQLQAHAYAQGTDIHIAPGQEKHLPHEAWHVVQQKQGRVKPTLQMKGDVPVNDDVGLENEADVMGAKAIQFTGSHSKYIMQRKVEINTNQFLAPAIQLMKKWTLAGGFENIEQVPEGEKGVWLKCKYKEEEAYISVKDMERFTSTDWDDITYYEEENADLDAGEDVVEEDKFPNFEIGQVTSITIIKESKSDHQYVIAMVKGGGNIKMHYGVDGGLCKRDDDIDNEHGVPVSRFDPPKGQTGDRVMEIFETTKEEIGVKFEGGNCGGLASELVGKLGGVPQKGNDAYDLFS